MANRNAARQSTPIDQLADQYFDNLVALSPIFATEVGVKGLDAALDDFSPDAGAQRASLARQTLLDLGKVAPEDATDQATQAALHECLGVELELHQAGEYVRNLNNITSPIQTIRDVFDLMPTRTEEDWAVIARRLAAIPESLASYQRSLELGLRTSRMPAVRQVQIGIDQSSQLASDQGSLAKLVTQGVGQVPACLAQDLQVALAQAQQAYGELASFLAKQLAPVAPEADGAGRERYQLLSRSFMGSQLDLDQTYLWGLERLEEIVAEQDKIAQQLYGPGTTVSQAYQNLDADPRYLIEGKPALAKYMNELATEAVAVLDGTHFDLPEPLRQLVGKIAPSASGGIYYTPPTEDFSRPGTMWWSVPPGVDQFHDWRERTTVYHEGVPGHHLQCGMSVYVADQLNRWRRMGIWISGHGEGWALYAEALMAELGYMQDPGHRMGWLDAMRLRAARVALDIGVHLGLPFPKKWGGEGETWNPINAHRFLRENVAMDISFVDFEFDRYLGWPGQAPSYLVGMRHWQELRAKAERQAGFTLKSFHDRALRLGALPLDTLDQAVLGVPSGS